MQRITLERGRELLLDGAHNPAGAAALSDELRRIGKPTTLIFGVLRDKNWQEMLRVLAPRANEILLVPVSSDRCLAPEDAVDACREWNSHANVKVCESLEHALALAHEFIVITGSLYLVGEAMALIGLGKGTRERQLNEWIASR
jgi:dihydrofolate synthase/folylpolyglutamate synthase